MIKLKPFRETPGFCGPASLKIVMSYYGVEKSEAEIARVAGASRREGVSASRLVRAAKLFGFNAFVKDNSSLESIRRFVKKGTPVIVDWFSGDDGHYSVVADIDKKRILLIDPELERGKREFPLEVFFRVWFDFPGDFIKNKKDLILRQVLVVLPKKSKNIKR